MARKNKPFSEIFRFRSQSGMIVFRRKTKNSFQFVLIKMGGGNSIISLWFQITKVLITTSKVKGYWILFYCCLFTKMFTESQTFRDEMQLWRPAARASSFQTLRYLVQNLCTEHRSTVLIREHQILSECRCESSLQHLIISRWVK